MTKQIFVEATYQIVSEAKGLKLAQPQTIMVPVVLSGKELEDPYNMDTFRAALFVVCEAEIKAKATAAFIQRLKTEKVFDKKLGMQIPLKRQIGGTKWTVEIMGGIETQPLYTSVKEPAIGDFKQFLRGKKVTDWDDEKKKQVSRIIYPRFNEQVQDRNYAIIKQLCEAAMKAAPAANDDQNKEAA